MLFLPACNKKEWQLLLKEKFPARTVFLKNLPAA
jgi:hypothetical protein